MKAFPKRIVVTAVSLSILAYVGYQVYLAFYSPVTTQRAASQTIEDVIAVNAYAVRSEKVITSDTNGILDYTLDNGDKVEKGGTVADVYENSSDAENEKKILELENKIAQLELSNVEGNALSVDIDVLNDEISEKFLTLAEKARSSNVEEIDSLKSGLLNLLNEKQIATGEATDFDSLLSTLKSELKTLEKNQSGNVSTISAPESGYFVSNVDGFENRFNVDNVLKITTDDVNSLLSSKAGKTGNAAGKVLTSFNWYLVCNMSETDAKKLSLNTKVSIDIPLSVEENIPCEVVAKNKGSGSEYAVVLESSYMSGSIATLRKGSVNITADSYTGIKVSNSCVQIVDGKKGVYILSENAAKFKTLDIIYAGDGFVLSALDPADDGQLQLYDQIIVGGTNLYDGKVIK